MQNVMRRGRFRIIHLVIALGMLTVSTIMRGTKMTTSFLPETTTRGIVGVEGNDVFGLIDVAIPTVRNTLGMDNNSSVPSWVREDEWRTNHDRPPRQRPLWKKLFPLDDPLPTTFLSDIPVEPWLEDNDKYCRVYFVDPDMSFCRIIMDHVFIDSLSHDVVIRLLEHRFECSAQHLLVRNYTTKTTISQLLVQDEQQQQQTAHAKCFWIPPINMTLPFIKKGDVVWDGSIMGGSEMDVAMESEQEKENSSNGIDQMIFLLPFLYADYYALMTFNSVPRNCIIDYGRGRNKQLVELKFNESWRNVFSRARHCDYLASGSRMGLILADSLGIPALATRPHLTKAHAVASKLSKDITRARAYTTSRPDICTPALEKHNVTAAQDIVTTFPFSQFTVRTPKDNHGMTTTTTSTTKSNTKTILNNGGEKREEERNRTLVIVLGSLRGGESTWQSMYRNLLDTNHADLALLIGETNNNTNTANESTKPSPYRRAKYIWTFPEYDDWADAIDQVDGPQWRETILNRTHKKSGILGGARGLIGSGAIIFMARHWFITQHVLTHNLTSLYDRFVLTRSDLFYKCPQNLSELDIRYLWVPSGEDYGGITDRHWIMNKHHLIKALRVYHNLIHYHDRMFRKTIGSNPEQLIRYSWTIESLYPHQIRRFPRTMYAAFVHGTDQSRWINQDTKWGISEDGIHIKYIDEYRFAKCYCGNEGHVYDHDNNITYDGIYYTNAWQRWTCHEND